MKPLFFFAILLCGNVSLGQKKVIVADAQRKQPLENVLFTNSTGKLLAVTIVSGWPLFPPVKQL